MSKSWLSFNNDTLIRTHSRSKAWKEALCRQHWANLKTSRKSWWISSLIRVPKSTGTNSYSTVKSSSYLQGLSICVCRAMARMGLWGLSKNWKTSTRPSSHKKPPNTTDKTCNHYKTSLKTHSTAFSSNVHHNTLASSCFGSLVASF